MCDYKTLVATLNGFAEQAKLRPLTLGEAINTLDEAAYSFIAIILVLPFMQPIPLGPLTVIGGLTFAVLGWQMLRGHESPVLPQRIRAVEMNEHSWRLLVKVCLKLLGFCRRFTKPRHVWLFEGRKGRQIGGFVLMASGLLMAIPFGVLPLNNVLPGLAILFYGVGELEQDGVMVYVAFFWLAVTVVYFTAFFLALWFFGNEAIAFFQ
ncbi:MAG TPA: exopolysaccharide biosynthesis protein [Novimethylophilus sp.]|jgi:hypothetical protein|uniref:exopolysaccharide biosynthesis protein n=1 Tax=Novimethylophilus sp. TaxID=2137426 RepID=UPI002F3F2E4F